MAAEDLSLEHEASARAARCLACPDLCAASCPVSHATARATHTPGGKMSLVALTLRAHRSSEFTRAALPGPLAALARSALKLVETPPPRALDADVAEAFYACTGCRRCEEACDLHHDVPDTLWQARAAAAEAGLMPAGAHALVERFVREGHAGKTTLAEATAALPDTDTDGRSQAVLLPGCEAPTDSPSLVASALAAARRLGAPLSMARAPLCCGRPLRDAGARDAFRSHLAEVRARLGRRDAIVFSPACAEALTVGAQEVGLPLDGEVSTIVEHLAHHLGRGTMAKPALEVPVVWHEPCRVARGSGDRRAAERLLEAAIGTVRVPSSAGCCGAGGLLPETFPEAARAMAMEVADELRAAGAGTIAVAAPECRRALAAAGLAVVDVVELVDRWLAHDASTLPAADAGLG
jgi:Fe-S oxidoreductase